MFLKSLTLRGFKSFADTTTLEFEPGVTVVVGPNGSGKSNIVDAAAWVLGAQGPRMLRSAKMDDVIFAGSPSRPALGRAEVSLTIDNSAGLLPIEFSEVTITRTLFRSGESEYALNGVPCRLLDIQELLSDTGVGRQQHVIVSQGNLDLILTSRPEERRLVIEEAAGILKYRRRKEKAERRLEATESSLVRLHDLLREVRRQLRPLEKQADAARRHGDVVAELTAVRKYLLGRDLAAVQARLASAARDRSELARAEDELRQALGRLDADILGGEAEMGDGSRAARAEELGEAVSRAEGLRVKAAGLSALLAERSRSLDRSLTQAVDLDVIASLEAETAALRDRLASTDREATDLLPRADELAAAEEELATVAAALEERWRRDEPPAVDAAVVRGELTALRLSQDRADGELRRVDAQTSLARQRCERLDSETERFRREVTESQAEAERLEGDEREHKAGVDNAAAAVATAEVHSRGAEAERHRWASREEVLSEALAQARARAGAERLANVSGVVGSLLELIEVDEGYECAFEAAAADALAAVLVDGADAARQAMAELQRTGAPGAVFTLPHASTVETIQASGSGEALRPKVRSWLPGVGRLLDQLLGSAVVVSGGWEEAADVALAHPSLVVVTRAGDRFSRGCWFAAAGGQGVTGAAVAEAGDRAAAAAVRATVAERALTESRAQLESARVLHAETVRASHANAARRSAADDALARVAAELAESRSDLSGLAEHRDEVLARRERDVRRAAELEELLPALEAAAEAEVERAAAERAERSRQAERTAEIAAMRRELEVRAAGLEERRLLTARRLEEVDERLRRNIADRDGAAERRRRLVAESSVVASLLARVHERERQLEGVTESLRAARRSAAEEVSRRGERLEQLRRQRSVAERQLGEQRERLNRVQLDETEARVRLEGLTEAVRRELDCEPDSLDGAECPALPPGTSPASRRSELERELRLMGPINPLALEEHAALLERHEFLEAQLEDVKSARRELSKVIRAVDAEIVEVFGAAYADVAEHFEKLFETLFPGGQGRLRLTDPEHLLDTGIEVEARPSGKNVRRLSLLSGGERSLTAMAFLFAVFRARPSPFYLLDEVEAALDDVNLHRFLDLVHEFRDEAQLLIVSHQKRTMEAADCLYGVTMAPGGASRVISERVSEPATT